MMNISATKRCELDTGWCLSASGLTESKMIANPLGKFPAVHGGLTSSASTDARKDHGRVRLESRFMGRYATQAVNLWLENFENLSLALFQSNSAPKLDALMGFDTKIKDFAIASTKLSICASELQVLFIKIWSQAHENFVVEIRSF